MMRWELAARLSDALERALPRGCAATLEIPARDLPVDPKDVLKIVAHVKYQNAAGAWQSQRVGASLARLARDPDAVIAEMVASAVQRVEKARGEVSSMTSLYVVAYADRCTACGGTDHTERAHVCFVDAVAHTDRLLDAKRYDEARRWLRVVDKLGRMR